MVIDKNKVSEKQEHVYSKVKKFFFTFFSGYELKNTVI